MFECATEVIRCGEPVYKRRAGAGVGERCLHPTHTHPSVSLNSLSECLAPINEQAVNVKGIPGTTTVQPLDEQRPPSIYSTFSGPMVPN